MIIDEEEERMYLRATGQMAAYGDVYLVDHAWTFKQRSMYKELKENEKLRERMANMMRYPSKRDLPAENPYTKPKPTLEEYLKQIQETDEPTLAYELDEYEIKDLKAITFKPEVEEISLWGNEIFTPKDITEVLMTLPNLRALWLNDNPVQKNCSNFNVIGDHFDKLEIFNSALTAKAGEWAMLFYARDTGAKTLEEIESLTLSGKNLLTVDDLSFL